MSDEVKEQENNQDLTAEVAGLDKEATNTKRLQVFAVLAFCLVLLIFIIFKFLHNTKTEKVEKEIHVGTKVEKRDLGYSQEKSLKELALSPTSVFEKEREEEQKDESPFEKQQTRQLAKPKVYKGSSSMMISSANSATSSTTSQNSMLIDEDGNPIDILNGEWTFDEKGKPVRKMDLVDYVEDKDYNNGTFSAKSAKMNKFDPNLYLAKGTYIGCSLNTRLVSTIKGGISCTVSEDVYSDNGVTLLIEKGSKITGSYKSGQMNDGMDRIFVVWQEIKTPNNVIIPINSGASDELGGSGIEGYVDHHWLQRFGAAILLSVIDDATNVALNGGTGNRNNNNYDYTENSRETTRDMANTALEKFINIEPTLYKNQGDIVGVYVNRDIDFSSVYRLRVKKGAIHK